jgi:hypothetical protein
LKSIILLVCGFLSIAANSFCTETVFGPSTIRVGTNEAILLTTIQAEGMPDLIVDGVGLSTDSLPDFGDGPTIALAGPHDLVVTNHTGAEDFFVTFQRLTNSPIRTVMAVTAGEHFINVPTGKTIQMFPVLGKPEYITVQRQNSTNWIRCFEGRYRQPSIAGPVTVRVVFDPDYGWETAFSYYLTDEVVQFPPQGLLSVPAPILQVNIEKSYDLTNWTPKAVFHTDAEAKAFYRLKMLK